MKGWIAQAVIMVMTALLFSAISNDGGQFLVAWVGGTLGMFVRMFLLEDED